MKQNQEPSQLRADTRTNTLTQPADHDTRSYIGIDSFRFFAALLVITIHTSPLASFSESGDFILTRILARTAVPFFFLTSGFFTVFRYDRSGGRLTAFTKKTARLYLGAILLYLPVNFYTGYFLMDNFLPNFIRDIVLDGTFYHLWYLPASIIGAAIARYFIKFDKKTNCPTALTAAFVLYLLGLFGDSYYGIAENIPCLRGFYELFFQVADYTRNGIFFAPVFFLLGGLSVDNCRRIPLWKSLCGFGISLALMLGEALTLHHFKLQRHDSMYLFLPPCVYFLFHALLHFRGKRLSRLRTISLMTYLIHPMMIIVIRLFAKLLHLQELLVENSILHFAAVCLVSVACSLLLTLLLEIPNGACTAPLSSERPDTDRAYIEINLHHLIHNAKILEQAMPPGCRLMAVVKAQAYGHGAYEIAACLEKNGICAFATATIDEGIHLRKCGIRGDILILGYTDVRRACELKKYRLIQTIIDYPYACALNRQGLTVRTHLKVDTGMHRLGIPYDSVFDIKKVFAMKHLNVCGIFTHLCCSDSRLPEDTAFTKEQTKRFYHLIACLEQSGIPIPKLHIQSSYGLWNYPDIRCDYVRAGIALYGIKSTPQDDTVLRLNLRPVLSLKSKVVLIRQVKKGEWAGYGRRFAANRDSRIAILPIGYGDGFPRNLSEGKGWVQIREYLVPIVGRICMDQLTVDITDAENVCVGDTATLIGAEGYEEISAPAVAENSGSISNELLCRLGSRLPVVMG